MQLCRAIALSASVAGGKYCIGNHNYFQNMALPYTYRNSYNLPPSVYLPSRCQINFGSPSDHLQEGDGPGRQDHVLIKMCMLIQVTWTTKELY